MIASDRTSRKSVHPDVLVGVGLALGAALLAFVIVPIWVDPAPYDAGWQQSPRLFPWFSTTIIGLLGLIIAWRAWRRGVAIKAGISGPTLPVTLRAVALVLAAIISCVVLANIIGMISSGVMVCLALMLVGGERRPMILLVAGVAIPSFIVELLKVVGSVPMPVGPFGF